MRLTACNFYRIWKCGEFFGYGPARAAHGYARVDDYALSVGEEETLVIETAGYRCRSFYALDEAPFLQAEILCGGVPVFYTAIDKEGGFSCSLLTERLQKTVRFSYQRAFSESYVFSCRPQDAYLPSRFVPAEEVAPRRLLPRRVRYPKYDEARASLAERGVFTYEGEEEPFTRRFVTLKEIGIFPRGELETFPSDALRGIRYRVCGDWGEYAAGNYSVFSFSHSETGFLQIAAWVLEACHFLVLFDEVALNRPHAPEEAMEIRFDRNACYNIVEYRAAAGEFKHLTFEPYTVRYVKIVVLSGRLDVTQVSVIRYESGEEIAVPRTGNDEQDLILEAAVRTFRHNAVDLPTDCPSRERAGWLCDSWFLGRAEKLLTGANRTETNFLENIALCPALPFVPRGMIPMCYPADFSQKDMYIPNWAMWYVLELRDYALRGGDACVISASRQKVYALFDRLRLFENQDGLLEDLDGWIFVEWSKANDADFVRGVNYPTNMMYYAALNAAAALYGDGALQEKAARLRRVIREQSLGELFFEDNRIRRGGVPVRTGHISETCQYYAFFTEIATREEDDTLWNTLVERFGAFRNAKESFPEVAPSNAFIGNYLRMILLHESGDIRRVRSESTQFFWKMAKRTGTLWEYDDVRGSLDHGFASYIAVLLLSEQGGGKNV